VCGRTDAGLELRIRQESRALRPAGLEPDLVIGTSIGAINGAVFATDPTSVDIDRLNALWSEVAASDLLGMNLIERVRTFARLRVAIEDPRTIRQLLERALPVRTFDQLAVEFIVWPPRSSGPQSIGSPLDR
jgi:NTE family protein